MYCTVKSKFKGFLAEGLEKTNFDVIFSSGIINPLFDGLTYNTRNILLIARTLSSPLGARKITTQLAKYPRVLYVKPSDKMTVLYCTVLYCTVRYCTLPNCTVLHCTALYCTLLSNCFSYCTEGVENEYKYPTILYCWLLYSTVHTLILLHLYFSFKLLKKV